MVFLGSDFMNSTLSNTSSKFIYTNAVIDDYVLENGFLWIGLDTKYSIANKNSFFRQVPGTTIKGCPPQLAGTEFIGCREVYWYTPINVMVRLVELHPMTGRVWTKFYNDGTWEDWHVTTPDTTI